MKRIISLVLAVSMVLSVFSTVFAANKKYTDLSGDNAKYAGAVEALTELGVIDGFTDNTFGPEKELTRAQVAKMLVICCGLGDSVESLTGRTVFSDVATSHWGAGYINAAAQAKIILGYPDGTFKPEKNVTYAEALTMALKALGYGNVVDAEGTWPTAYMLKAVELELTDDMEGTIVAGANATRGNTAILLWNMLRTPMWKIYEESQGNGMTLSNLQGDYMLNVKFPKYTYDEDVYVEYIDVKDKDEVRVILGGYDALDRYDFDLHEGKLNRDVDISRLVLGMKVTCLIKDYKDSEKATFLTLTPEYDFVEGFVSKFDGDVLEINGVEYKKSKNDMWPEEEVEDIDADTFVVVEVDGKKIVGHHEEAVLKTLPNAGSIVTKPSALKSRIDEDDLVIIDGVWSTRDDIEEGDVYTILEDNGANDDKHVAGKYVMVARERVNGSFESLTFELDSDTRMYFEVDGEEYKAIMRLFDVVEGEDEDEVDIDDLLKKKKENDYLDEDIELVFNYLHAVVRGIFGTVGQNGGSPFYAVMSNGVREITDPETGDSTLKIRIANPDDLEGTMTAFTKKFELEDFGPNGIYGQTLGKGATFKAADEGKGTFIWAKFNDKGEIKDIQQLEDTLEIDRYEIAEFNEENSDGLDRNTNYITIFDGEMAGDYKVTTSTVVYKLIPQLDEDDDVVGFELEIPEDPRKALSGVDEGLIAYDVKDKINANKNIMTANYVFIMADSVSSDYEVGKVEATKLRAGISYVKIDGEWEEVDLDAKKSWPKDYGDVEWLKDDFIVFARTENEEIVIRGALSILDLFDASVVTVAKNPIIQLQGGFLSGDVDLEDTKNDPCKEFENFKMISVKASVDKDGYVEFDDGETIGTGLPEGKYRKGDRVLLVTPVLGFEYPLDDVIFIVSIDGVDEKDFIDEEGYVWFDEI